MDIPSDFQPMIRHFERQSYCVKWSGWSSPKRRHFVATLERDGQTFFLKAGIAAQRDLYEPNRLHGLQREVWFATVIGHFPDLPVRVPKVSEALTDNYLLCPDAIAWVLSEYVAGTPLVYGAPEFNNHQMTREQEDLFQRVLPAIVRSLQQLSLITHGTLQAMDLPDPPPPPHGIRRRRLAKPAPDASLTLGNGAFELKNLRVVERADCGGNGQSGPHLYLVDNEFASDRYPPHDQLAYFLHRLACVQQRPDLAQDTLDAYFKHILGSDRKAAGAVMATVRSLLWRRALGGIKNDICYRGLWLPQKHWQALRLACALLVHRGLTMGAA